MADLPERTLADCYNEQCKSLNALIAKVSRSFKAAGVDFQTVKTPSKITNTPNSGGVLNTDTVKYVYYWPHKGRVIDCRFIIYKHVESQYITVDQISIFNFKEARLYIDADRYGYSTDRVTFGVRAVIPGKIGDQNIISYSGCMWGSGGKVETFEDFEDLLAQRIDLPVEYNVTYPFTYEGIRKAQELAFKRPSKVMPTRTIGYRVHEGLLKAR